MKKLSQSALALLLLLALAACEERAVSPRTPVPAGAANATTTVQPTAASPTGTTVLADGQLVAIVPLLPLGFETSGRVRDIAVVPGQQVEAGELVATLDGDALEEALANAQLQLDQAENSLAQAQLSLEDLESWEPDETAVAQAEANLAAAEAAYENAETQDAAAGNNLTSTRVNLAQAERQLAEAQEAYDTAWQEARDWELNDPWRRRALEAERDATASNLQYAQENVEVARAQYNLAWAGLNNDTAISAEASLLNAQQALKQARTGPTPSEIEAAQLRVEQAELSLEQSRLALEQAQTDLDQVQLLAPWAGTVVSVEVAPGARVTAGSPILTLLDTDQLQFHTSNLSERDLAAVTPGQPATIVLKSYPGASLAGTVARIAPQSSGTVGDAAIFTVTIDLEPTDLDLRPGMTGRVEIQGE